MGGDVGVKIMYKYFITKCLLHRSVAFILPYLIGLNFIGQNFRRTKFFVGQTFRHH